MKPLAKQSDAKEAMPVLKKSELKSKTKLVAKAPLKTKTQLTAKTPVTKQPKQHTVSWYKKEADRAWSLAVRYRFAARNQAAFGEWFVECLTCGTELPLKKMQCGHFMSRQYNSTRYHEQNTGPQCFGCNVMQQGRQYEFGLALDDLYGTGTAKRMHDLAKVPHQFKREELINIIKQAKEEIGTYENN